MGALVLLGLAQPGGSARYLPPPDDPRPAVTVRFEITAQGVTDRMRDSLAPFQRLVGDTVRAMLRRIGFIRWVVGPAADTLAIRWYEQPRPRHVLLRFALSGRHVEPAPGDTTGHMFEPFQVVYGRERSRWTPRAVEKVWASQMERILDSLWGGLVRETFGRLPIRAAVDLRQPDDTSATVRVQPQDIEAAEDSTLEFRVRVTVTDERQNTRGPGVLYLRYCAPQLGPRWYVCDIHQLNYRSRVISGGELHGLLARVRFDVMGLHVYAYPRPASDGGALESP